MDYTYCRFPPPLCWEKLEQSSVVWLTAQHFPAFKSHLSRHITFCHSSPKAAMVLNVIALIHLACVWANSWMVFKSYTVLWGTCACVYLLQWSHSGLASAFPELSTYVWVEMHQPYIWCHRLPTYPQRI